MSEHSARVVLFGASLELPFTAPQPYNQAEFQEFSKVLTNPVNGLGIPAQNIRLHLDDTLFGYRLVGRFFGENGSLFRDSERLRLNLSGGRTKSDLDVMTNFLIDFHEYAAEGISEATEFSAYFHAEFTSPTGRDEFLAQFRISSEITDPGAIGSVLVENWPASVRIQIEKSYIYANAVFLSLTTRYENEQDDWRAFMPTLTTVCESAAGKFLLKLMKIE